MSTSSFALGLSDDSFLLSLRGLSGGILILGLKGATVGVAGLSLGLSGDFTGFRGDLGGDLESLSANSSSNLSSNGFL